MNIKFFEKLKEIKGKMVLVPAGLALAAMTMTGCEGEVTITPDPSGVVVEVTDPETTPEIIETTDPVEDPVEEDLPLPEFRLYNEDGSEYEPVEVTADDIYKRVGELEEKYGFEDDWKRDASVAFMLYQNLEYMSEEDANIIYSDYLENFGMQTIDSTKLDEFKHIADNTNVIPLSEYYIDERLAAEAEKLENYYDNGQDRKKLEDAYAEAIKEEPYYYTTLVEAYYRLMPDVENSHDYYEYNDFLNDDCIYTPERVFTSNRNSYESSHDSFTK